jgi:hypothetical protein
MRITEQQAIEIVNEIADIFNIGICEITKETILTNVNNAVRRSKCLSQIESYYTIVTMTADGEECESLLNWGETPELYIKTYTAIVTPQNAPRNEEKMKLEIELREIAQKWHDRAKRLDDDHDFGHALAVATAIEDCAEQIEILIGRLTHQLRGASVASIPLDAQG